MNKERIVQIIKRFAGCREEDDTHEFKPLLTEIEESPSNPLGHAIFWLIISFIFIAGLWMYLGKVDIVVTARGKVIPDGEEKIVQSLEKGVVSSVLVKEGDYVKEGQLVAVITPAEHEPELELNNLRQEEARLSEQMSAARTRLSIARDKQSRLNSVRDIIPKARYDEAVTESSNAYHEVNSLSASLTAIRNKRLQLEKLRQELKSPVEGYVNKIMVHTIGGVVTPAEPIMTIVSKNAPLQVRAQVMNQDVGFVAEGMDVSIKVDTFNFQKYGILKGKVTVVSPNSIDDEKLGPVYEVYIKPENLTLLVEGKEQSIKAGMSTTNEINIGKRRIIEFFIYPLIKYLDESIKVR